MISSKSSARDPIHGVRESCYNIVTMLDHFSVILAVAAFIKNKDGHILIVKKSAAEKVDGGLWTVPGGKVDQTEPILDALKREVFEEAGVHIITHEWIGEDVFESGGFWYHGQHFLCSVENTSVTLEKKLLEYAWITAEDLSQYEFHPNIRARLQKIFSTP